MSGQPSYKREENKGTAIRCASIRGRTFGILLLDHPTPGQSPHQFSRRIQTTGNCMRAAEDDFHPATVIAQHSNHPNLASATGVLLRTLILPSLQFEDRPALQIVQQRIPPSPAWVK